MKDYMEELAELRGMLKFILNKELLTELVDLAEKIDNSYVQRYVELKEQSTEGSNCGHAAKAKDLFLKLQERPIAEKIESIYNTFIKKR